MTISIFSLHVARRRQLSTLTKITMTALIGYIVLMSYAMVIMAGRLDWRGLVFIAVTMILVCIIAAGWRWALLLGAVVGGVLLMEVTPTYVYALTHATNMRTYAFQALFMLTLIVGVTTGVAATVQNYRGAVPTASRRILAGLVLLVVSSVVTILLTVPRQSANNSLHATAVGVPTLTTANFAFDQAGIRAKVGETVTLRLINRDPFAHSFDVDEFDAHVPMLTGEPSVARFTPTRPGTYSFYCGVPGHRLHGMVGTLIVEP